MATAQPLPQLHTHIGIPPAGQEGAERAGRNWDCRRLRPPQHRRALRGQSGVRARGRGARPPHSPLTAPPPPAPPQRRPRPSSAPRPGPGPVTPRYSPLPERSRSAEQGRARALAAPQGCASRSPPGAPRSPPPLPPPAPLLRHRRGGRCLAQKPAGVTKPRAARRNQSAPRPRSRLGGERHVTGAGLSPPCPPPYLPAAPAVGVREQDGGGGGGAPRSWLRVAVSAALRRPLLPPPLPPPPGEVPGAVPGSGAAQPQPPSQGHPNATAAAPLLAEVVSPSARLAPAAQLLRAGCVTVTLRSPAQVVAAAWQTGAPSPLAASPAHLQGTGELPLAARFCQ